MTALLKLRILNPVTYKYPVRIFSSGKNFNLENKIVFSVRPLKISEFKEVLMNWSVKEGWNPGKYEYIPFYTANPVGHKGLFISNKLAASVSYVRYSKEFAFLGIYIVEPIYRKAGVGQILANSALKELDDCALMGINAVQNQVENYQRKYGFMPSYTNSRWSGYFKLHENTHEKNKDLKIVGKESVDVNQLIDYDASIFSVPRELFLRKWIEMPSSQLLVAMQDEKIRGYGVISECVQGYKLAPLFTDNEKVAKKLYESFAVFLQNKKKPVQLDIPDKNLSAVKLALRYGLHKTLETTRMYKGDENLIKEKNLKNQQVYSITTLELG